MANLDCQLNTPGRREPQRRNCLHQICAHVCRNCFRRMMGAKTTHPLVGGATPGQMALGYTGKLARYEEGKQASEQLLSMTSASVPVSGVRLEFLP